MTHDVQLRECGKCELTLQMSTCGCCLSVHGPNVSHLATPKFVDIRSGVCVWVCVFVCVCVCCVVRVCVCVCVCVCVWLDGCACVGGSALS